MQYRAIFTVGVQQINIIIKSNMDPSRYLRFHNNLLTACYNAAIRRTKIDLRKQHPYLKL